MGYCNNMESSAASSPILELPAPFKTFKNYVVVEPSGRWKSVIPETPDEDLYDDIEVQIEQVVAMSKWLRLNLQSKTVDHQSQIIAMAIWTKVTVEVLEGAFYQIGELRASQSLAESQIAQARKKTSVLRRRIKRKDAIIADLSVLSRQIEEKDAIIAQKDKLIAEASTRQIGCSLLELQPEVKDEAIADREARLDQQKAIIAERDAMIAQQEAIIADLIVAIDEKDSALESHQLKRSRTDWETEDLAVEALMGLRVVRQRLAI